MVDLVEINFGNAEEFLDYLRPSKKHWFNVAIRKMWFFRGLSNPLDENGREKWSLIPSIWRNYNPHNGYYFESRDKFESILREKIKGKEIKYAIRAVELAYSEFLQIDKFASLADVTGFHLPRLDEWNLFKHDFLENYSLNIATDINNKIWEHPIVALAQHHGVPTRLLDWTENPLVAAYFAILSYNSSTDLYKKSTEKISVYAVHRAIVGDNIRVVTASKAENQNLRMQEGLFLYDTNADRFFVENEEFPTLNDSIEAIPEKSLNHKSLPPIKLLYRRISLSIKNPQDPNHFMTNIALLRELLERENITDYHLMPSLDNIAKAVNNRFRTF
jgi:hypothetical protein